MKTEHKSGFVNIIGNPNVGKSTFLNAVVGEELAITTPKAQTTRHRILGIVNDENYQIVFSDTPGIINPAYELQESMMDFVKESFEDADILLYMVEAGEKDLKNEHFFQKISKAKVPVLLLINKVDQTDQQKLNDMLTYWQEKVPNAEIFPISALHGFGVDQVLGRILELLPSSPPYFGKDQLTDKTERFIVNEKIREKILKHYKKEIPYSVEIDTEEFIEEKDIIRIRAIVYVERDSQKGIIIGHKGAGLKRIGTEARKDLEKFFNKKIFLQMYVKVNKDWRKKAEQLKRFGYKGN
jgi:GTP-binding protein Era